MTQWINVNDRMPEEGQSVAFVVFTKNTSWDYLNGKVLGGTYFKSPFGGDFSIPGLSITASHWNSTRPTRRPTMTDRELLELAALAAGIKNPRWSNGFNGMVGIQDGRPVIWNPLARDGDAFRLAVRLRIDLGEGIDKEPCAWVSYSIGDKLKSINEPYGGDPYGATRRAAVRAAAEIGKTMTGE